MGRWWKDTYSAPSEDEERRVTFKGDPGALSKKWPILWRFHQNWRILKVERSSSFSLYFRSASGQCMKYRWPIWSDYVAVRVGPDEVAFWAVSNMGGDHLKIVDMGVCIPRKFRTDVRSDHERADAAYILREQPVFI
jgi:hypothetical protein